MGKCPSARRRAKRDRVWARPWNRVRWERLVEVTGSTCLRCGHVGEMTRDHVVPLKLGGKNWITNLQPLCLACNKSKGQDVIDYRPQALKTWLIRKYGT